MINDELSTSLQKEKKVNDSFIDYDCDAYRAERHDRGNVAAAAAV